MSNLKGETQVAFCPSCEDYRPTKFEVRKERYTVRGQSIEVQARTEVCTECGEAVGADEQDKEVLDAVHAEYRRRNDLLTPERMKDIRGRYRLSQKSFAALLGMSEATINRYEQGALQDPPHDTAIRACERPEVFRDLLERRGHLLSEWQRVRAQEALAGQAKPEAVVLDHLGEIDWICMPKELTERTGFRQFDYQRFAAVTLWFCSKLRQVSRTTINKLLFYSDFLNFKTETVSLTGAAYRRLEFGPCPADYGGLHSRMESEGLMESEEVAYPSGHTGCFYRVGPQGASLAVEFSDQEQNVLESVAKSLGHLSAKTISERSHREPAWLETEDKQLISYYLAEKLSLSLVD